MTPSRIDRKVLQQMEHVQPMEMCFCPECGLPAEVVSDSAARQGGSDVVGVRCVGRHWFFGLRERLVA